ATEKAFVLDVDGRLGAAKIEIANGPNTEVLWSPDSEAFMVTENAGGPTGSYALTVVGPTDNGLAVRHLSDLVTAKFGHPAGCVPSGSLNVVGVAWLNESHELLAVAELVPHSNCRG